MIYRIACSRDGPEGVKRTYVQDLIAEDGQVIWNALGLDEGWVYISGYVEHSRPNVRGLMDCARVDLLTRCPLA